MTVINPLNPTGLSLPTGQVTTATAEGQAQDLRPEQIVRATVVDDGLERPLLELNHRQYRPQAGVELRIGQQLTLQVLKTQPQLEFRVIGDALPDRLTQLLPMLTHPFDWTRLLGTLQQLPQSAQLSPLQQQVYTQLQQLLQPVGGEQPSLRQELNQLVTQLQLLGDTDIAPATPQASAQPGSASPLPVAVAAENISESEFATLLQRLQGQLQQLPKLAPGQLSQGWVTEMRHLLLPLQQQAVTGMPLSAQQFGALMTLLTQFRQQPQLPLPLNGQLEQLQNQLTQTQQRPAPAVMSQATAPQAAPGGTAPGPGASPEQAFTPAGGRVGLFSGAVAPAAPDTRSATGVTPPIQLPTSAAEEVNPQEMAAGVSRLLEQVRAVQAQKGALAPELLGRLEGLLERLRQLPPAQQAVTAAGPGLELLAGELARLVQQPPVRLAGEQLGALSMLFGFHLEAELLQGKKKEALASLKASLLKLKEDLGEAGKEPLKRLELLQLCKAKLGEDQVQFLPLPFNELEEGYLLAEKSETPPTEGEAPLHLSLSLRLSELGNLRVDMLYEKAGLHLRVACEDRQKMNYLQDCAEELKETVEAVPLQGVSFAADAKLPTRELLARVLPEAFGVLNARV